MLTQQQHKIFTQCAHQLSGAALHSYAELSNTASKLDAYNVLLEPPIAIREANAVRAQKLREQAEVSWTLYMKVQKAQNYLLARPTLCTYISECTGKTCSFIAQGLLPNFEEASADETRALQSVEEYYAAQALQAVTEYHKAKTA